MEAVFLIQTKELKTIGKIRKQREEIKAQVRNSFPKKGATSKQAVNKNYTKQEQDEAWVKFSDRIQKNSITSEWIYLLK